MLMFQDPSKTVTIEATNGLIASSPDVKTILVSLAALNSSVVSGMDRFVCEPDSPHVWRYRIRAKDGRLFRQMLYTDTPNAGMTFAVSDIWKVSEFEPHRTLRDGCLALIANHGLVSLVVEWA